MGARLGCSAHERGNDRPPTNNIVVQAAPDSRASTRHEAWVPEAAAVT